MVKVLSRPNREKKIKLKKLFEIIYNIIDVVKNLLKMYRGTTAMPEYRYENGLSCFISFLFYKISLNKK